MPHDHRFQLKSLIALSSIDRLDILFRLFKRVYIPDAVYQETVTQNPVFDQRTRIVHAISKYIRVVSPKNHRLFIRKLGAGEQGVLNLAIEMRPDIILLDDKKARNEANDLDLAPVFTADILKLAEHRQIIASYQTVVYQLSQHGIYIPE